MSMDIFRPVKKWLIPLLAVIIGISAGFILFPSAQDYYYKNLVELLNDSSNFTYEIDATYYLDGERGLTGVGYWSEEVTTYNISIPVSDNTSFDFDIFLEADTFYINNEGGWTQGELPHSVIEQMNPLDDPFAWAIDILHEADQLIYEETGRQKMYTAFFENLGSFDFMGYKLDKQENTSLSIIVYDNKMKEMSVNIDPIRPDDIARFDLYPDEMEYTLYFSETVKNQINIPPEARNAEFLD